MSILTARGNMGSRVNSNDLDRRFILLPGILCLLLLSPLAFAVDTDGDGLDDSVETNTGVYVSPTDTSTDQNCG